MAQSYIRNIYMDRFSNINTLLAFVTVAHEGSVSRAAQVLNLTQPAISHQIKRLSEDTGVTLFRRTAKGVLLTRDGEALLVKAEQVLDAMAEFRRSADRRTGQIGGALRIGTIVDPEFIRLGQLLIQLRDRYPNVETELMHGMSGDVLTRLQHNQIDVGFYLSGPRPDQEQQGDADSSVHFVHLADLCYRVIAPAGWQGRIDGKDWSELAALPWIGTPADSVHQRLLGRIFDPLGCKQNVVALVDQEASMLEMVRSGMGLSLCRDSIALHQQQSFGLAMAAQVSVPACLSFATLDARKDTPTIAAILTLVENIWQSSRMSDL